MSDIGTLCPITTWLNDEVIDPDLLVPIAKARLEFKGKSEDYVEALWDQFHIVLHRTGTFATYRADHRLEYKDNEVNVVYDVPDRCKLKPDYIAILRGLISKKDRHLNQFILSLDEHYRVGQLKTIALLILYEAMDRNPDGVIKASILLDRVHMQLRPMIDVGLRSRKGRQLGAKKTAAGKSTDIKDRDQKILSAAMQLLASRQFGRRHIASVLAKRFDISVRTIRRILKAGRIPN